MFCDESGFACQNTALFTCNLERELTMIRKDQFVVRKIGDHTMLVPTGAMVLDLNGLITLNDTALCIWEYLDGRHAISDIARVLAERFEVDREQALSDVEAFIREIEHMGLLEGANESAC